jgi:hypothetical protein
MSDLNTGHLLKLCGNPAGLSFGRLPPRTGSATMRQVSTLEGRHMSPAELPLASCPQFASNDFDSMHHRLSTLLRPHRLAVFEWLESAEHPRFRDAIALIK